MGETIVYISMALIAVAIIIGVIWGIKFTKGQKKTSLAIVAILAFIVGIAMFNIGMNQVEKATKEKARQSMLKAVEESDFEENVEEEMQEAKDEMDTVTEENSDLAEATKKLKESRGD